MTDSHAEPTPASADISPTEVVTRHLDEALQAARSAEMSTSELVGLFFYYAHSIAASYRDSAVQASEPKP